MVNCTYKTFLVTVAFVQSFACVRDMGGYDCVENAECDSGDVGRCEPDGYCSYFDSDCDSGRRYGSASGEQANQCLVAQEQQADTDEPPALPRTGTTTRDVTVDTSSVVDPLIDFPVPVVIRADVDLANADLGINNFRFAYNGTELDHEINHADLAAGELFVWVKMPVLPVGPSLTLQLEYGADVSVADTSGQVWSNDFAGVYHFDNSNSTDLIDSSPNGRDGVASPLAPNPGEAGQYGTGSSGCWSLGDVFRFEGRAPFSISFWARAQSNSTVGYPRLGESVTYTNGRNGYTFEHASVTDPGSVVFIRGVNGELLSAGTGEALPLAGFAHVVGTYDGSTLRAYWNGQEIEVTDDARSAPQRIADFHLGCENNNNGFNGVLDEYRVSTTARSAAWVAAEYGLNSAGSAATLGPPVP